jgi:hypothetical protein
MQLFENVKEWNCAGVTSALIDPPRESLVEGGSGVENLPIIFPQEYTG